MKYFRLFLFLSVAIGSGGCSTLVTEYLQHADSFDHAGITSPEAISAAGFSKSQYCSDSQHVCISYLTGAPLNNNGLKYQTELTSGGSDSLVELTLSRTGIPQNLSGTVVLLHGFRASKEFMLNSALYFRFLGFDVIVPDLLGHGESGGEKHFGVNDRFAINELIDEQAISGKPLLLLGNSMGAVTASYIASMRNDVSGVILQAPMLMFDEAVLRYTSANFPYMRYLFSEENIIQGADNALSEAQLTTRDTDIKPLLNQTSSPVLILASESDPVAPVNKLNQLSSDKVTVKQLNDRNHPSMAVIGDEDSDIILQWLLALKAFNTPLN